MPKMYNLRTDPCEFANIISNIYFDWFMRTGYLTFLAQSPIQRPNSFAIDDAIAKMSEANAG